MATLLMTLHIQDQPDSFKYKLTAGLLMLFYVVKHDLLNIEHTLPGKGLDAVLRIVNTEGTIDQQYLNFKVSIC